MKLIFNLFVLILFIPVILSNENHDYSQMYFVCTPVYSRIELQKILETSVNSLAFQIPVKPLFNSLNKSNSDLNIQSSNQNSQHLKVNQNNNRQLKNDVKLENRHKTEDSTPTIYSTTTTESTTTVEPSTTILSTKLSSTSTLSTTTTTTTSTTTTASPTTTSSTTTQSPTTIQNLETSSTTKQSTITHKPRSIFPIKTSNKRYNYYKSQTAVPNQYVTTTDLPTPAELNTNKPSLAKIRSRLFNLFQPRQFNSNLNLHKPRGPDYPTLSPKSLFNTQNNLKSNNLNNLNTNSIQQSSKTTTVEPIEIKSISSTESYPQIQSSIIPDSLNSEQSNLQITTSSSLDLSKIQSSNDNLLAVASSSRFHSVLNSNDEKTTLVNKAEEKVNDKKEITELKTKLNKDDNLKDIKNEKTDKIDKIELSTTSDLITGPLKLDEIFADFNDNNDTLNEKNIDSNPVNLLNEESSKNESSNDKKEDNINNQNLTSSINLSEKTMNENVNETTGFVNYDNSKEIDYTTESILEDELIVKKITEVIEADEFKNQKNDNEEAEADKNLSIKNDSTDNEKSISNEKVKKNDLSKGQLNRNVNQDKKLEYDKINEFIEIPTGTKIDKSINDDKKIVDNVNSKNINESINDKKTDKLTEIVNETNSTTINLETTTSTATTSTTTTSTTAKPIDELKTEINKSNTYTYPIEYMIKDYLN